MCWEVRFFLLPSGGEESRSSGISPTISLTPILFRLLGIPTVDLVDDPDVPEGNWGIGLQRLRGQREYGIPSVIVAKYARATSENLTVPSTCFYPAPDVAIGVPAGMEVRKEPELPDEELVCTNRPGGLRPAKKNPLNNLHATGFPEEMVARVLRSGIDGTRRAETLVG